MLNQVSSPLPKLLRLRSSLSERTLLRATGYLAFVAGGLVVGYFIVCTTFGNQDDEGYVLIALKQFLSGGALYHSVYTQYGPFPYELWGAVYKILGLSVTPDSARITVLILWLVTSLFIGATVERLTGSILLGLVGAVVGFAGDTAVASEPMHPGGLSATMVIAIIAAVVLLPRRRTIQMAIVGFLLAALIFTKINIGAAAVLATLLVLSATSLTLRRRRWLTAVLTGISVLVPFVLMSKDLSGSWAQNFAALIALGVAAVGVCLIRQRDNPKLNVGPVPLSVVAGAFLGTLLLLSVVIVGLGTSPHELVDGVLIKPLKQPDVITIPAFLPTLDVDLGVAGLACAIGSAWLLGSQRPRLIPGLTRVVAGLLMWLWVSATVPFSVSPNPGALGVCIPLSWLVLVPPRGAEEADGYPTLFTRAMLAALPVLGAIVAFPVAGDQMAFAAVAFVPVAGLIVTDGVRSLSHWNSARSGGELSRFPRFASLTAAGVLVAIAYQALLQNGVADEATYRALTPLPFSGATLLRQPAATTNAFTEVVGTIRARCNNFITLPGMNSFYLWSHITPPTNLNATTWMYLLNASQQQRVVNVVAHIPHLCLIRNNTVLAFWATVAGKPPPNRPLWAFTHSSFKPIFSADGYDVLIRGS